MIQNVVFDTNVLISGYLWKGKPRQAIRIIKSGNFRLLYCKESLDELIRVLTTKFKLNVSEVYRIIFDIKGMGKNIEISSEEHPINEDPSDNLFINLAIDGNARVIVSGDTHLVKLKEYKRVKIFAVSEFLKYYSVGK